MWRQEVNVLFRKPNTQDQEYINEWNLLRPLTAEMFDSIWRRVSDSEFTYDDCTFQEDGAGLAPGCKVIHALPCVFLSMVEFSRFKKIRVSVSE